MRWAVPSWLSTNATPRGSFPASVMAGVGWPVVVIVKVPPRPLLNVALPGLVIAGASRGANTDIWYLVVMWGLGFRTR